MKTFTSIHLHTYTRSRCGKIKNHINIYLHIVERVCLRYQSTYYCLKAECLRKILICVLFSFHCCCCYYYNNNNCYLFYTLNSQQIFSISNRNQFRFTFFPLSLKFDSSTLKHIYHIKTKK